MQNGVNAMYTKTSMNTNCAVEYFESVFFFVKGRRVLQDIIPVPDVPEKVKRREPYIKVQIKLLLYNSHCVSTTVSFNMECTLTRYIQTSTAFIFESALSWEPSSQSICNVSVEEWIFKVVSGQNLRGRKSSFRDRAQNCLRPEPPSEKSPQPHLNHYVHL